MIDDFLSELFGPSAGSGPASFADRFGAISQPTSESAPADPRLFGDVPLPRPRPVGSFVDQSDAFTAAADRTERSVISPRTPGGATMALFGMGAAPLVAKDVGQEILRRLLPRLGGPDQAPSGALPFAATDDGDALPPGAGPTAGRLPGDIMARLMGGGAPAPVRSEVRDDGPQGLLGRLLGLDGRTDKRLRSSLAGGFSGGNPAFAGGALMKGISGGLSGGLKSDKEDTDADVAAEDRAQKQGNFERQQSEREKTGAVTRDLYGARTKAVKEGRPSSAWNKPAHERFKDAERLIIDKQKQLYGAINPLAPKAEREALKKESDAQLDAFRKRVYKQYGFDEQGNDVAPAAPRGTPSSSRVIGDKEGQDRGLYSKGSGTYDDPHVPQSQQDFDELPPGTYFKNPADGRILRKRAPQMSALDDDDDEDLA